MIAQLKFDKKGNLIGQDAPTLVSKKGISPEVNTIGPHNPTIIGDFIVGSFTNPDTKWLVQCFPKANMNTLRNRVEMGEAQINHRYIFVMIGAN